MGEVVRVVYATSETQHSVEVAFENGMKVADAVSRSGLLHRFPAAAPLACAVFGQLAPLERSLSPGDRVEILRPLLVDPKENRRQAARSQRGRRSGS